MYISGVVLKFCCVHSNSISFQTSVLTVLLLWAPETNRFTYLLNQCHNGEAANCQVVSAGIGLIGLNMKTAITYVGGLERTQSLEVLRCAEFVDITLQRRNAVSSLRQRRYATFPLVESLWQTLQRHTSHKYITDIIFALHSFYLQHN